MFGPPVPPARILGLDKADPTLPAEVAAAFVPNLDTEYRLSTHQCHAADWIWGGAGMDTKRASEALSECAGGNGRRVGG